ncbi:hypothetical protein N431DRAFT_390106 [Stipitochalara longipes BDJ]|nr:hypothetical protein N431DRAFT_390106 [Stipitochalara longipes BDJ]
MALSSTGKRQDSQNRRAQKLDYELVPQAEGSEDEASILSSRPSDGYRRRYVSSILWKTAKASVAGLALLGAVSLLTPLWHINRPETRVEYSCGNSTAEAKALGCKFDELASAWLPAVCRDDALTEEFSRAGPNGTWKYYSDPDLTTELSLEELSLYGDLNGQWYFMTGEWHIVHCAFYWRKKYRAPLLGITLEPRYDSLVHVEHCGHLIRHPLKYTHAGVILDTCYSN